MWIDVNDRKPKNSEWVLGLINLGEDSIDPVMFQVKYQPHIGWSDWAGDIDVDYGWKVTHWLDDLSNLCYKQHEKELNRC